MNISSVVVKTNPKNIEKVIERLAESRICEVHFSDEKGRIVVTIEGSDSKKEMEVMKEIQNLPDVLSVELSYTYSDDEFKESSDKFQMQLKSVPDALKDS